MVNSGDMQADMLQVTIQAAMVVVKVTTEADLTTLLYIRRNSSEEPHTRQAGPALCQPAFAWKAQGRYVELLNFEMEVSNIPQMKIYYLYDEDTVSIIKKMARLRRAAIHNYSYFC